MIIQLLLLFFSSSVDSENLTKDNLTESKSPSLFPSPQVLIDAKKAMGLQAVGNQNQPNFANQMKQMMATLSTSKWPIDEKGIRSFADLARLYSQKDAPQSNSQPMKQSQSLAESIAFLKKFFTEQSINSLAFVYEMQGKYGDAVELTKQQIATIEANNFDHHQNANLAQMYNKYSRLLFKLRRTDEASVMAAKAHFFDPQHY